MRRTWGLAVMALAAAVPLLGASRLTFDDLLANLKSPNVKTRLDAVDALGKSRRREAVAPLAALVHDPETKVRLAVEKALQDLRDISAVPALVTLIGDSEPKVREEAISVVVDLYTEQEHGASPAKLIDLFSDDYDRPSPGPFTKVDPAVYGSLGTALHDDTESVRQASASAIGILEGRPVAEKLTAALQDPAPSVRGAAATSLGKVGTAEQGKQLIPLLADESTSVRNRAVQSIGNLRVREAGPALRALYEANRRRDTGLKALASMSRVADPDQADLFRELVQDPDPDRRRYAVEGLARVADASMLPAFKKDFQRERSDELKLAYAFAISRLGDYAFLDSLVLGLASSSYGRRCQGYLLEMGRGVLPELYGYLGDPDAEVRAQLCDVLAALGDAGSVDKLAPLVGDPSPKVADHATRALERLRQGPR